MQLTSISYHIIPYHIKERGMYGQDRGKTHVRNFSRQTERDQLGDLGINGRKIFKKVLDETGYDGVD